MLKKKKRLTDGRRRRSEIECDVGQCHSKEKKKKKTRRAPERALILLVVSYPHPRALPRGNEERIGIVRPLRIQRSKSKEKAQLLLIGGEMERRAPPLLSTSARSAYRALRRSLRASGVEDRGLVSALNAEFRRLLLRGGEEEEKEKTGKGRAAERAERASTVAAATSTPTTPLSNASTSSALVRDFAFLLSAVRHQRDLLLSYDIGVDRDARQMETIRRTAARVGLRLPGEEGEAREEGEAAGGAGR